jgi:hypothetical protein
MIRRISVLICFFISLNLYAQSFTLTTEHNTLSDTLNSTIIFNLKISNTSEDTLTLFIKWIPQEIPEEWGYSVCFDQSCFPAFIDSITTTEQFFSSPLIPGDIRDLAIDVYPLINYGAGSFKIIAADLADLSDSAVVVLTASVNNPVSVKDESAPVYFSLLQNYPNPFNPSTDFVFEVSERSYLALNLFSVTGEKVASIAEGEFMPGIYRHTFDASKLSSGLYIARLSSDTKNSVIKIMLEK